MGDGCALSFCSYASQIIQDFTYSPLILPFVMEQKLIELIKEMGAVIRQLDENCDHSEYWLNDEDDVPTLNVLINNH